MTKREKEILERAERARAEMEQEQQETQLQENWLEENWNEAVDYNEIAIQEGAERIRQDTGKEQALLTPKEFRAFVKQVLSKKDLSREEVEAQLQDLDEFLEYYSSKMVEEYQIFMVPKEDYLKTMKKDTPSIATSPYEKTDFICDKVAKAIFSNEEKYKDIYSKTGGIITVSHKGQNFQVKVKVTRKDSNEPFAYDQSIIYNAVCNLYNRGYHYMTDSIIFREIKRPLGVTTKKPTEDMLKYIQDTMESFRYSNLYIEPLNTKTANYYTDKNVKVYEKGLDSFGKYDGYFLINEIVPHAIIDGVTVKNPYKVTMTPFLYSFAHSHIMNMSEAMKPIAEARKRGELQRKGNKQIRSDNTATTLEYYFAQRIAEMKRSKRISRDMLFDTIFEKLGTKDPTKKERSELKKRLEIYAEKFKNKGTIKNYSFPQKGRAYYKISIEL